MSWLYRLMRRPRFRRGTGNQFAVYAGKRWVASATPPGKDTGQRLKKPSDLAGLAQALLSDALGDSDTGNTRSLPEFPSFESPLVPAEAEQGLDISDELIVPTAEQPSKHWTQDEKMRLKRLVEESRAKYSQRVNWEEIQRHFKDRTKIACMFAYTALNPQHGIGIKQELVRQKLPARRVFIPAERQALIAAVRKYGEHSWLRVAKEMERVTGVVRAKPTYRTLWHLALCPKAQAAPEWTEEKTTRLRELVSLHGPDEVFITYRFFPEYTPYIIRELINGLGTGREGKDPRFKAAFEDRSASSSRSNGTMSELASIATAKAS